MLTAPRYFRLPALLLAGCALPLSAEGQHVSDYDRFRYFTECAPVTVMAGLGLAGDQVKAIGLTRDRVETMIENRLRVARVYEEWKVKPQPSIYADVKILDEAVAYIVVFEKPLDDPYGGGKRTANTTPGVFNVGFHGGEGDFIMQRLTEHVDEIIADYLRVNEGWC